MSEESIADDDERRRKLGRKRWNERIKLFATFFNGIGIASVIVSVVAPMMQDGLDMRQALGGLVIALTSHALAQVVVGGLRSEE